MPIKRSAPLLRRAAPLKRRGKRVRAWETARRRLKSRFLTWGITRCELRFPGCYRDTFLGFAHARKRRNLRPGELEDVILACHRCHDRIERLSHEEMYEVVMRVIEARFQ